MQRVSEHTSEPTSEPARTEPARTEPAKGEPTESPAVRPAQTSAAKRGINWTALRGRLRIPLSFWDRFTASDPGLMAAAVAFNAFLALVPAAFGFFTAASLIGASADALGTTEETLHALVPAEIADFIISVLVDTADLVSGQQGWIIAVSLVIALWSGSRGVVALQKALARIERHEEHRPAWRLRLIGIALTVGAALVLVLVSLLVIVGDQAATFLVELTGLDIFDTLRVWIGVPASGLGIYLVLYGVYRWGPPDPIDGAWLAALISTLAAALASVTLGLYLGQFAASTLGVLGAVGLVLLWLYVMAYVVLFVAAAVGFGWRRALADEGSAQLPR